MSDGEIEDSQDHEEELVAEEDSPFVRDSVIEQAAVNILGYTVDEVKRKTLSQLSRELEKAGHGLNDTGPNSNATDDELKDRNDHRKEEESDDDAVERLEKLKERFFAREERRSKKTVSFQPIQCPAPLSRKESPPKKKQDKNVDTKNLIQQRELLDAKLRFTKQLEQDDDFTRDDLADWNESIERLEKELRESDQIIERKLETWKRKQEKIEEMDSMGLLDEELKRTWQRKQNEEWKTLKKVSQKK